MTSITRNVIALVSVPAFFYALDKLVGRLAYEGLDVLPDDLGIVLLVGISLTAAIVANQKSFSNIAAVDTRYLARGSVIAVVSVIIMAVSFVATVHVQHAG